MALGATALWRPLVAATPDVDTLSRAAELPQSIRVLYLAGMATMGGLLLRVGGLTISDGFFFAALLGAVGWIIATRQTAATVPVLIVVPTAIFALGGLLATFAAAHTGESIGSLVRFCYVTIVWFWLSRSVLTTSERVSDATLAWTCSMAVSGGVALLQSATGSGLLPGADVAFGRVSGLTGHFNDLGAACAIAFIPAVYLAIQRTGPWGLVAKGAALLTGAGLVFSGSNGAAIGAGTALLVWFILARPVSVRSLGRLAALVLVAAAVVYAAGISVPNPLDRFHQATNQNTAQTDTLAIRTAVLADASAHIEVSPLNGVGLGEENGSAGGHPVHNLPIAAWYQAGVLGYIGIVLLVLAMVTIAVRTAARDRKDGLAPPLIAACVCFLVIAMGQPVLYQRYGWVAPALLFALYGATRRSPTTSAVEPPAITPSRVADRRVHQRPAMPRPIPRANPVSAGWNPRFVAPSARGPRLSERLANAGPILGTLSAALVGQFALLVSGVIAARLLGVADRGHVALFALLPVLLSQVLAMGLPLAVTFEVARDPASAQAIFRSVRWVALAQAGVAVIVQTGLMLALFWRSDADVLAAALITVPTSAALIAQSYALAFLQGARRFRDFNVWRAMPPASYAAGMVLLVVVQADSLQAVTLTWMVTTVLSATGTIVIALRRSREQRDDRPNLKRMIRFGLKGMFGAASPLETYRPDQAIVGLFLSPASLGLYVSGVALTNLPRFVASSIGMVTYPVVAGSASSRQALRATVSFALRCLVVTLPIVVVLEVASKDLIVLLFGQDFAPAATACRILLIGAFLLGMRRVVSDGLRGAGYAGIGSIAEGVSWIVFVPAVALLASTHGLNGVAVAVVIASAVSLGVVAGALAVYLKRVREDSVVSPAGAADPLL